MSELSDTFDIEAPASAMQGDNIPDTPSAKGTNEIRQVKYSEVTEITLDTGKESITAAEFVKLEHHDKISHFRLPKNSISISPIQRKRWHGKDGIEAFQRPVSIEALYDINTGGYGTGLTEIERLYLEAVTGNDLSTRFNQEKAHPFWSTAAARLKLPNKTIILDLSKPNEFIKYKLAQSNPQIANSLQEWNKGIWTEATHYIINEVEESEIKGKSAALKFEAMDKLNKLQLPDKKKLLQALTSRSYTNASDSVIYAAMDEVIQASPSKVLLYLNMNPGELMSRALVYEAIALNILVDRKGVIFDANIQVGVNYEEAVKYYGDTMNQDAKINLINRIKDKRLR